ncbi:hypothetical protein BJY04DRAFT_221433 [Aspergillus karnatakaensis]|uniref:uncharacterized protein n=1 Tax=Aspergillus karnatakaensis TaxID=1810916 RepID=UPI003CCCA464
MATTETDSSDAANSEKTFPWFSLPGELQIMIFQALTIDKRGLGAAAAVCKAWQTVIEQKTFERLELKRECLSTFASLERPRELVRYIWLNIELPRYTPSSEGSEERSLNNTNVRCRVADAIYELFHILHNWPITEEGLTLELNVYNPSDSEQWFKNWYYGNEPAYEPKPLSTFNDPKYGWADGKQVYVPERKVATILFQPIDVWSGPERRLDRVDAITGFVLRRQCRRQFSQDSLTMSFNALPRLPEIHYEPWRTMGKTWDSSYATRRANTIQCLPSTVRKLTIFEEWYGYQSKAVQKIGQTDYVPTELSTSKEIETAEKQLGSELAHRSLEFEHLSLSFFTTGSAFFRGVKPGSTWPRLESLMLTSTCLSDGAKDYKREKLLKGAARVALRMPQLRLFVLWHTAFDAAAVFTYCKKPHRCSLTWRATWEVNLDAELVGLWEDVALKSGVAELEVKYVKLSAGDIQSHGDAIHHLELPEGVIDPVSLWQIRQEAATTI